MKMKLLLFALLLFLSGCATQTSDVAQYDAPGFLYGLLHGFLILFTFIGSFFTDYDVYAVPNNGWPYNFGFIIGASIFFGGGARSAS